MAQKRRLIREPGASVWRRMDYWPVWLTLPLGLGLGGAVGWFVVAGADGAGGVGVSVWEGVLVVAVLLGAVGMAWSGRVVGVEVVKLEEEPEPEAPAWPDWLEMVEIPGGTFLMGSPDEEEGRQQNEGPMHEVRISAFECMKVPVTRALLARIRGEESEAEEGTEPDLLPAVDVSWFDAVRFCNQLSDAFGLLPCYAIEGRKVTWNRDADGFRLPTEAEWEYACRAGSRGRWCFGDDEKKLGEYAWFVGNSEQRVHPVGEKKPNTWGLQDMHGNVWEWCWDWYGDYSAKKQKDPAGSAAGDFRVIRGGAFLFSPGILRSAFRNGNHPEVRNFNLGFRCVRVPSRQP